MSNNSGINWTIILPIITAILGGLISYGIAVRQSNSAMKIKRIEFLENKIQRISNAREKIITRKLNLPNGKIISADQMGSSAIDSSVNNIWEILSISEYFDNEFIVRITEYHDELQNLIGKSKLKNSFYQKDEEIAKKLVSEMSEINKG